MKKKILLSIGAISAIGAPIAAVISCGGSDEKLDVQPLQVGLKDSATLEKNIKGKKIGFVNYSGSDTFMKTVQAGIESNTNGGTVNVGDSTNDQSIQKQRIDTFISDNVDGLNVNLVEPASAINVINLAKANDIPLVLVNKEAPESTRSDVMNSYSKLVYVGSNPFESGTMQAELIYKDLEAGIIKDINDNKKIDYVVLGGQKGHADAMARSSQVRVDLFKSIKENGVNPKKDQKTNIEVDKTTRVFHIKKGLTLDQIKELFKDHSSEEGVATFVATVGADDWSTDGGKKVVANLITDNKRMDFIAANNDDTAIGGFEALGIKKEADGGKKYTELNLTKDGYGSAEPDEHWIPVYGIDANTTAIESIKANGLAGTVKQDGPGIGKASNYALSALILGVDIDEYFKKNSISVTKDAKFSENRAYRVPYKAITRDEAKTL